MSRARHSSISRASATLEASRFEAEHRFAEEYPAELNPVQAAHQLISLIGFDRVAVPQVRAIARKRQSCPHSARCRGRSAAAPRSRGSWRRSRESTRVLYGPLRSVLRQTARAVEFLWKQHHAWIRRPPQNRLLRRIPGKDPPFIRGQEAGRLEVAAGGEQPGRFPQGVLQRRKPVGIGLFAQPDESAQSCNSSSGARW